MILYNAILCCDRDSRFVQSHIHHLDKLSPMSHCVYYAMGSTPVLSAAHHIVGCSEGFDELTTKVYGMFKHALTVPGWTHLLKTDVNTRITKVDWDVVERSELTGYVGYFTPPRTIPFDKFRQPILREQYYGPLPPSWVGGPAYAISRNLTERIVERGVWDSRRYMFEDIWVSLVAWQNGITPASGIGYIGADGAEDVN